MNLLLIVVVLGNYYQTIFCNYTLKRFLLLQNPHTFDCGGFVLQFATLITFLNNNGIIL